MLNYNELAADCDKRIRELDAAEKKSPDIEDLIVARQKAEIAIVELDATIVGLETEIKKCELYRNKQMKDFDELCRDFEKIDSDTYAFVLGEKAIKLIPALMAFSEDGQSGLDIFSSFIYASNQSISKRMESIPY